MGRARAGLYALVRHGAADIVIANRTVSKAKKLARQFAAGRGPIRVADLDILDNFDFLPSRQLVVNCTPLGVAGSEGAGQSPLPPGLIEPRTTVFDLVYNPVETPLTAAAKSRGAKAVSGLGMLVYQAAESFKLWTAKDADTSVMFAAARASLG